MVQIISLHLRCSDICPQYPRSLRQFIIEANKLACMNPDKILQRLDSKFGAPIWGISGGPLVGVGRKAAAS